MVKKVLSINYSDSTGYAGIQNDLKIFQQNDVFGFSVITHLTTPKKDNSLFVEHLNPTLLSEQLTSVFSDGSMDATKIGAINSEEELAIIINFIKRYHLKNIVLDISYTDKNIALQNKIINHLFPFVTVLILTVEDLTTLTEQIDDYESDSLKNRISKLTNHQMKTIIIDHTTTDNFFTIFKDDIISTSENQISNLAAVITSKLATNSSLDSLLTN